MKGLFLLFFSIILASPGGAFAANGQRIGLCGDINLENGEAVLIAKNLPPIKLITEASLSKKSPGGCAVGLALPIKNGDQWEFAAKRVDFLEGASELVQMGLLPPVQVCGLLVNDGPELYIQFGPSDGERAYLRSNAEIDKFKGDRLDSSYCAYGEVPPSVRGDGKIEFDARHLQSDWLRSGFSVGNL